MKLYCFLSELVSSYWNVGFVLIRSTKVCNAVEYLCIDALMRAKM